MSGQASTDARLINKMGDKPASIYSNLQELRVKSLNLHCGRLQQAVLRAIRNAKGRPVSTREILLQWAYRRGWSGLPRARDKACQAIRYAGDQVARRVGRSSSGSGRPILWASKEDVSRVDD
jgi:hypothetical protein